MTGTELVARVAEWRPELPAILMSGYSSADLLAHGLQLTQGLLLTKPFTEAELLLVLRQALGQGHELTGRKSQKA